MADGTVKVSLNAPPVAGRANRELMLWLSEQFRAGIEDVSIVSGRQSRRKTVRVINPGTVPEWINGE